MAEFISGAMKKAKVLEGVPAEHVERSRMIAKHTAEYLDSEGNRRVRYVQTTIFEQLTNGTIILRNGGYLTPTTKKRIIDQLPGRWTLWQEKGAWYLSNGFSWANEHQTQSFLFVDSMRMVPLGDDNYEIEYTDPDAPALAEARNKQLKKLIGSYCKRVDVLAKQDALPVPDLADCFFCQTDSGPYTPNVGTDHLMSHLEEQYIVGSLIANAYVWAGYTRDRLAFVWGNRVGLTVRRYLKFRFGLA